jgi:hypothetical protein
MLIVVAGAIMTSRPDHNKLGVATFEDGVSKQTQAQDP